MIRNVLRFLLLAPEKHFGRSEKAWYREHEAVLKALGASLEDWIYSIEATPSRVRELLKLFRQLREEKARVNGYGYGEELIDDDRTPVEWFTLNATGTHYEHFENSWEQLEKPIREMDDYLQVRADRLKPGIHVAGTALQVYVSERFRSVVEAHRLTGIAFVWCRDIGKYRSPQWYLPVCAHCLGRGLDSPWIDPGKLSGKGDQTLDPRGRHGQTGAEPKQYRRDAGPTDPAARELLRLLRSMELLKRPGDLESAPRYLRKYLPDTDFAGTILDMAEYYGKRELHRHRGLAMNRKTRDLLQAHDLVTDEQCKPVLIVNRPPKGVENLDRRYGPAEPALSPEQMAHIRELEAAAWADHVAHPKPAPTANLARSLALVRSRKRQAPSRFARPAAAKAIAEAEKALPLTIPEVWRTVLRIANGGTFDNNALAAGHGCSIIPAEKLAKSQKDELNFYRDIGAALPDSLLVAMQTELGDSIWLDTAAPKPNGDCRVVLLSHETGAEEREWPSVAEFLDELLTAEAE